MNLKKIVTLALSGIVLASGAALAMSGNIDVVSREDGSGTRGAFVELAGILDEDGDDATTDAAEITNSTSVMLTTVAGDARAIGYVSLGSMSEEVKAVMVDGVEASVDNILAGTYAIARPFNLCYKEGLSDLAQDFIAYIFSTEGQTVVSDGGYISIATEETASYVASGLTGSVTLAGSTSVAPIMEKLAEAYMALNPDVTIEIQQSGSSAGIQSAIEGVCEIGMSSRELKDSEIESGLTVARMAQDGIAVIVNLENDVENLTMDQIRDIFLGTVTTWDELAE